MSASPSGLATVLPRYGEASLADVLPSVLAALGLPGALDPLGLTAGPLDGVRTVAVLLVDGLGQLLLPLAEGRTPTLDVLARGGTSQASARVITAGFPSTTPTSLTTLGTGAAPGEHGLVGFSLNVPGTLRVLNHLDWTDEPDPRLWQPLSTQFERARAAGIGAHVVSPAEVSDSGLSRAAYRGGAYVGAAGVEPLAAAMLARVAAARDPTVIYGYHPDLDKAGHLFGVDSPQWRSAMAEVDRLVTMLVDGLPSGSAVVVTADHGQLDIPPHHRFDLDSDARLRAGVRVVAGEPRVRHLHVTPGARPDVIDAWRAVLGDAAWVVAREEAVAQGWFGPVTDAHLARIGDVVVACHADFAVLATRTEPERVSRLVALHGSATAAEMLIPLLVVRR